MADHGTHHHHDSHSDEVKSKTAFKSSFWFVIILVGLFIAALNFINVMGSEEGHHGAAGGNETKEATSNETLKGETGLGVTKEDTTQFHSTANPQDTGAADAHH
jgi:hypothetical protein